LADPAPVGAETVEQVVRAQLSKALGGKRGMLEAAVPTLAFTLLFLTTKDLRLAVVISVATALVLLLARAVHRSTVQFVMNSLVGIGIGAFFAWRSARAGGDADAQALAYFLPGMIYNGGYAVLMTLSNLVSWPVVGFMVGSVAGDPTEWHRDPQVVRLCRNLTWMLAAPCVLRLVVQLPIYLAGRTADDAGPMVAALGVSKIAMGWPLQILGLAGMAWLLGRNHTPVGSGSGAGYSPASGESRS
jgi:energy-converting hydrogenase Eha subunit E